MASKSREAQEKLAQLEKDSAPFADQLVEAVKFIGSDLELIGTYGTGKDDTEKSPNASTFHGREEWLLRWLLKRLQSPKEDIPRKTPTAWKLLCHILKGMPIVTATRILQERRFVSILRHTLEEAKEVYGTMDAAGKKASSDSSTEEKSARASKKRKRSGELVTSSPTSDHGLGELLEAIFSVISFMQLSTKPNTTTSDDGRGAEFSSEAMRSVLRTTSEESSKILGLWLSLSRLLASHERICQLAGGAWLSHFIDIWELHTVGIEDLMQFSLFSSQALISLLRTVKSGDATSKDWVPVLEELVARNIMIPAKAANVDNPELDLIGTLTRVSVIQDSNNAPLLFEIAIRSIQPQRTRTRRPEDDSWLQKVFNTLVEAMPPTRYDQNSKAIRSMLQSAIEYKVDLELLILRSITSKYALSEGSTNWELLQTIILLDANVFLIPDGETNLLQEVLTRITTASAGPTWQAISGLVVSDVVLPLMSESAHARDLSGFIRHWYAELVEFEKLRKRKGSSISIFSAWEDDALQTQLANLFEPSLTLRQITEILDFLEERVEKTPEAVCVILEAIAGSITREDVIDTVQLRLYHLMFDSGGSKKLDARYKWRSWRILSRTLSWVTNSEIEKVAALWHDKARPFKNLSGKVGKDGLLKIRDGNSVELEPLESLRTGSVLWERAEDWSPLRKLAKASMLDFLQGLAHDIKSLLRDLRSSQPLGEGVCGCSLNTQYRGVGWMIWSFVQCVFEQFPKTLELGLELPDDMFREMLQNVFWIASASVPDVASNVSNEWLRINSNAFPDLWMGALLNPVIQNNETLIGQMIDIMLTGETNVDNPLVKAVDSNAFAIRALLQIPMEIFSRKDRRRIRQGWLQTPKSNVHKSKKKISKDTEDDSLQTPSYQLTALNPEVLALKVKIMQLPTSYEGMKFDDLVHLADALAKPKVSVANPRVHLAEFKKLAELTLMHMTANLDQPRSQEYISDAIAYLRKQSPSSRDRSKKDQSCDFASATLSQIVLSALLAKEITLDELKVISSDDLNDVAGSFKDTLRSQMKSLVKKTEKLANPIDGAGRQLELLSIIDALTTLGVDGPKLAKLTGDVKSCVVSLTETQPEIGSRLDTFIAVHARDADGELLDTELKSDSSTIYGRQEIIDKVAAMVTGKDQQEKLDLLQSTFGDDLAGLSQLDKLLAARYIISTCKDTRRSSEDEGDDTFDLSTAYSMLCSQLCKATSVRQFLLLGETMEMLLRTKGRAISQWNIDSTLGGITILCSRNGPTLRPNRAGNIYLHLCHLLQAVLTDHRLKLQGHFHLVVQCLQALLRCLFAPLPRTSARSAKLYAPPPWLSSPQYQLKAVHAAAFTRLVTSICDPSVSSVTRSQHNSLTSATDKAKRMAGQHMQFVLMTYVKLQLEMKMLPEVREKMVPGLYAIFDTTTPELRKVISESLDSSGRAVFGALYRDYAKFGKWKGS